ncbi:MFS transporter [Palleronia abyssalis]|uniref:Putative MFS-type transporter YhjX n=1 Tax=Palleronia abyssalis TaxID=1501240 RepID=A0A2R8BS23_9RHOB|nr:MFS transporter [Palleronia abyssalis]SPJ22974.1 putative MFS-type transporter YhjX [Palleronia abyssalis]
MQSRTPLVTPVLIAGSIVILVSFAVRASFGVFQIPIGAEFGWPRSEFSLAIAIQNLAWGIGQPIFAAFAERFGDRKAIVLGAVMYAAGLVLTAFATSPLGMQALEVLVGFGVAGTGFGVILAVVGRAASDQRRSMALAIATAAGSGGQVIGPPVAEALLGVVGWEMVFIIFAGAVLASLLVLPMMRAPAKQSVEIEETMGELLSRAFRDPSYTLIFVGFFSCGYQLGFITAHFPALVTEMCAAIEPTGTLAAIGVSDTAALGAVAIGVIGLSNIGGTLIAGWLGNLFPRKNLLAGIYFARTIIAATFISLPITPGSVLVFSVLMGALWLATVPLTAGLVGHLYGLRYMGTLYGVVFFSHQLGSFMGVWLGGELYDIYGTYTAVWWVGVGVGAFSAIVHLPIRETRAPLPA